MEKEVQQCFLQCMLQRAALTEKDTKELYRKTYSVFGGRANPADFPSFISSLNRTLKPLGMEIAMGHMEDTGEVWYGLVNRVRDTAAKICSGYTPAELELFNRVLEMVSTSERGVASSTAVLREVPTLERKLSHRDAQSFLNTLCKDKWLHEEEGVLSPGPRFILELRPFLHELFGEDISNCHLCKDPAIQGQKCESGTCGAKLHLYCAAKLFSGRTPRCPVCHADWPHTPPQIDPAHSGEDTLAAASSSGDGDGDRVDAEVVRRGSASSGKGRGRKKGKARATSTH